MNEIVGKCESFVEILQLSVSAKAELLTPDKILRAFAWANYFEKIYQKFHGKSQVVAHLNKVIEDTIIEKKGHHGNIQLTFETFKDASNVLYHNFLSNPNIPAEVLPVLYDQKYKQSENLHPSENTEFIKDLTSLAEQNATFYFLRKSLENIKEICKSMSKEVSEIEEDTNSFDINPLFRARVEKALEGVSDESKKSQLVSSSFDLISQQASSLTTILSSLLPNNNLQINLAREDSLYYTCAISWIKKREGVEHEMSRLRRDLVVRLVPNYFEVFKLYLNSVFHELQMAQKNDDSSDFESRISILLNHPNCERVRSVTRDVIKSRMSQAEFWKRDLLRKILSRDLSSQ